MKNRSYVLVGTLSVLLSALAVPAAQSGNDNQLFLLQESPSGALTGNTLTVDQSAATGSLISGPLGAGDPAIQRGSGNELEIEITGEGGYVEFIQDNSGASAGNNGIINVGPGSTATLSQNGDGNTASLTVNGLAAQGAIVQEGLSNQADLNVVGNGASGEITQVGNGNVSGLTVTGAGTTVSFEQTGDGLSYATSYDGVTVPGTAPGVQVISNGASVTITQSTF
ncbi:hypothetical protein [Hoeflea ulvae]|uniref:Curlin n=1 Tax=Hoeflea ulvae TaxID=2983764 RepID=A0ABT3YDT1_9HYPH|nr:hypothetical protein [Hoeflea ulvae]MCY0094043.1 hypothetical protein [Hoeflea ulvae]